MTLCQCVVTLRVWYLFPRSRFIRWLAVTVLIICVAAAATATGLTVAPFETLFEPYDSLISETLPQRPAFLFTFYLPALVLHTTMLLFKIYRFYISPRALQRHGIIPRIIKEGMFMYAFAAGEYIYISILHVEETLKPMMTGTLLYEIVSLSMTDPEVYDSALGGNIAAATTVVSVCRAMLSIRSLAATYHVDPAWLLNHAELSRVQWRRGATEGEIYVEANEMDVVLPSQSSAGTTESQGDMPNLT
ncbi:hypothetical protein EDB19DRAFT_2038193 [Suillus lakei]|nr:hypothetical protein EDB19DRAFT_2038193 [Suillus lakei]